MASIRVRNFLDTLAPTALEIGQRYGLNPKLILAQAALETGWGDAAPGNNYFGVKSHGAGGGQVVRTHEMIDGRMVAVDDSFRVYDSVVQSMEDYANFLATNPRYSKVFEQPTLAGQIKAIDDAGYATDDNYRAKLTRVAGMIDVEPYQALAAIERIAPIPQVRPASLGNAALAAMPNEWPAVPPIQREIPPPPRPRPPDAAPPLPLRRPDRPQAQPAFQGRSLGDDLALSPIQGGRQEMPLFDGAYDPVIDAIRPTVPYDGRGIGFVSTEAPREAALLPPIAPPAPRSAPKPATQSRMLAAQRDARDVGAGFQERYGDLLPMLETSGGSAPPTMPVMPSSDMRLMRSANNMAQQEAAAPAPSAPRPPSTYDVGLAKALGDRTTRPAAALPTAEQLAAATGFRAAPSSRPISEMAAIYSQGGPTRPAQPAVVRTGQITPLPPPLTPNGAIVQGKVQDRLTADLLPEPIPVGGGMNPTLARPAPVPAPLSSRPPAPPARPVAPTTSTRVAPVPLPASARPLTGTGGVDIDMPQMPAVPTVAPVPAQRLARPGVFGSPKLGPWDIKLPGALGVVQDLTAAMNNASGPFSNGADNLAYNVMRGGDFNAPGAATGRAGGYLYAPKEGGGFINVGRADRTMSAAELYDSLNARNSEPRNAAERAKSNSRRYDSGPSSLWE